MLCLCCASPVLTCSSTCMLGSESAAGMCILPGLGPCINTETTYVSPCSSDWVYICLLSSDVCMSSSFQCRTSLHQSDHLLCNVLFRWECICAALGVLCWHMPDSVFRPLHWFGNLSVVVCVHHVNAWQRLAMGLLQGKPTSG